MSLFIHPNRSKILSLLIKLRRFPTGPILLTKVAPLVVKSFEIQSVAVFF